MDRCKILEFVDECLKRNSKYKIFKVNLYNNHKAKDDGYRAIHLYFRNNNRCFPIEIQIWNHEDALLNFYTHDIIYKNSNLYDFSYYSYELRKWINEIPQCPEKLKIDFIKYLYKMLYL